MAVNQQTGIGLQRMRLVSVSAPTGVTGLQQMVMTATGAAIPTGTTGAGVTGLINNVPYQTWEQMGVQGIDPFRGDMKREMLRGVDALFLRSPFSSPSGMLVGATALPTGLPSGTGTTIVRTLTIRGPQQ